jgi:hypothetical protein
MTEQEAEAWWRKQIASTEYRSKLCRAREKKGWTIREAAEWMASMDIGVGRAAYYDIEMHEGDFTSCYSLNQTKGVCEILGIHPRDLFCDKEVVAISIKDLAERMKRHYAEKKISISDFEDIAGWKLESCLASPSLAFDEWSVDCLIDISRELGTDWRGVIAGL